MRRANADCAGVRAATRRCSEVEPWRQAWAGRRGANAQPTRCAHVRACLASRRRVAALRPHATGSVQPTWSAWRNAPWPVRAPSSVPCSAAAFTATTAVTAAATDTTAAVTATATVATTPAVAATTAVATAATVAAAATSTAAPAVACVAARTQPAVASVAACTQQPAQPAAPHAPADATPRSSLGHAQPGCSEAPRALVGERHGGAQRGARSRNGREGEREG